MTAKTIKEYLASIGAKGGAAGTGEEKKRGSAAHYRRLAERSAKARRQNAARRERLRPTAEMHKEAASGKPWVCVCASCLRHYPRVGRAAPEEGEQAREEEDALAPPPVVSLNPRAPHGRGFSYFHGTTGEARAVAPCSALSHSVSNRPSPHSEHVNASPPSSILCALRLSSSFTALSLRIRSR